MTDQEFVEAIQRAVTLYHQGILVLLVDASGEAFYPPDIVLFLTEYGAPLTVVSITGVDPQQFERGNARQVLDQARKDWWARRPAAKSGPDRI